MWLPWIVLFVTTLGVSALLWPVLYPDTPPDELEFIRNAGRYSSLALLLLFGYSLFATQVDYQQRLARATAVGQPVRATWNEVVQRADRGQTVRLTNLSQPTNIVSWDPFEAGQRIALLPSAMETIQTPLHLSTVQQLRNQNRFEHPTTRRRLRSKNIRVVRIVE
jgi:hypothetical protein